MGHASNVLMSSNYTIINKRTNIALLTDGEIIPIYNQTELSFEKRELSYLLRFLFNRKSFTDRLIAYGDIKKWGWIICQGSVNFYPRWWPGQQIYYYLYDSNVSIKANHIPLYDIPRDHRVRMRIKDRIIRLEGRNAGPYGYGSWKHLETKKKMMKKRRPYRQFITSIRSYQRKREQMESSA